MMDFFFFSYFFYIFWGGIVEICLNRIVKSSKPWSGLHIYIVHAGFSDFNQNFFLNRIN